MERSWGVRVAGSLLAIAAVVLAACGSQVTGELQLVVADQTEENPIRDVIEVVIGQEGPIYPGSDAGGTPTAVGEWTAGESMTLTLWSNAREESEVKLSFQVPADSAPDVVSLILEIEDNQVLVHSADLGINETYDRSNPVADARLAAAEAAEADAQAVEEEAQAVEEELQAYATKVRSEASQLETEIFRMQTLLNEVLDEHATVYGEDGWADFNEIERKYKDYTADALDGLRAELSQLSFATKEVSDAHSNWQSWWSRFFELQSRSETAARNNDSGSMDAVRAEESQLWDDWSAILDHADELTRLSSTDL
jgi:hypothetical protein